VLQVDQPAMTNDAKLGLVLGVAIVLVIALVFFRHEPAVARTGTEPGRATTSMKKAVSAPATHISPRVSNQAAKSAKSR
jgi:hypothetical protein